MSRSVNKVILVGNLGKDAESRAAGSSAVANFSIATTRRYKKGDEWVDDTNWHNIVAWNIEKLTPYLTKGKQVYVEGRLQTRSYEKDGQKRYVTEVVADEIILLGGNSGGEGKAPTTDRQAAVTYQPVDDQDVPF